MAVIEANIDAYGTAGRLAALADFVEFSSLQGKPLSRADLRDVIDDNGWGRHSRHPILMPDEERDEEPDDLEEQVFALLDERIEVLGDHYPFDISSRRLVYAGPHPEDSSYVGLLATSMLHAWKVNPGISLADSFEAYAAECIGSTLPATATGTARRAAAHGANSSLEAAGRSIGLTINLRAATRRVWGKDHGLDILAGFSWGDNRPGSWVLLGQATVGETGTWNSKIAEPSPTKWSIILGQHTEPTAFLAVPHHVDSRVALEFEERGHGFLIDRVRLSLMSTAPTVDIKAITRSLLATKLGD